MSEAKLNIYQKMARITAEIPCIDKDLSVGEGQKAYAAVSESAILAAVKPLEEKYGVYSYPLGRTKTPAIIEREYMVNNTTRKATLLVSHIETTYRFINIDNPEEFIDVVSFGTGIDYGDKADGKGMTYSDKYALIKAYKISTGNAADPDTAASETLGLWADSPVKPLPNNPMAFMSEQKDPVVSSGRTDEPDEESSTSGIRIPTTVDEARSVLLEIGKYKGKTFGEVSALSPQTISFYAGNDFQNDKHPEYKAAAQLLLKQNE